MATSEKALAKGEGSLLWTKKKFKDIGAFFKSYSRFKKKMEFYKITEHHTFPLYCDYLYCSFHYHCTFDEFFILKLYIFKNSFRKNFLMREFNHSKIWRVNKKTSLVKKYSLYKKFKSFYKRECFLLDGTNEQDFENFVKKHKKVIVKPNYGSCGDGIFPLTDKDASAIKVAFRASLKNKYICEEYISQHPTLSEIYPGTVNTCRFLSFYDGKEVTFLSVVLRCGRLGRVVDNICAGGIGVDVDIDTGILITPGVDYGNISYIRHPNTKIIFPGTQLPFWQETLEFVKQVHLNFTECSLLGIDIAFTPDGPCLVELNNAPGPMINQQMRLKPCGREIHEFVKTHRFYDKHNHRIKP